MRLQPAALADYQRAQTIQELTVINAPGPVNWIGDTRSFWYAKQVKGGTQYMLIDAENETEFGVAETYHLHMVPHDGDRWRAYLAFRDHLRSHPDTAREYERLKRHNASVYVSDRLGYNEAKSEFVRGIAASTVRTY